MLEILNLTDAPLQQQTVVLPDGSNLFLTLYYRPQQYGWFINTLQRGDFTLNGLRITNNPNLLRQWKNRLPFGLACFTQANREPTEKQDFLSGQSKLYILTEEEVIAYERYLAGYSA